MPRGISLHVGINKVSSAFPGAATLKGCENDAGEMEKIAVAKGFEPHDVLLGLEATHARVTTKILSAAAQLEKGDIFFFTFSGHGFQNVDTGSPDEPDDHLDETMLLFDVQLIDDVLRKKLWPCFKAGVRILMIADSCHSGSVFLVPPANPALPNVPRIAAADVKRHAIDEIPVHTPDGLLARTISPITARLHWAEYGEFYRRIMETGCGPTINASLLLLAACQDTETTGDGDPNGVYTAAMLKVLKNPDPGSYNDLVAGIRTEIAPHPQHPVIDTAGQADPDFIGQKPFTI